MPTLHSVIAQYIESRRASRYSEHTIRDYQNTFRLFTAFVGEGCAFEEITSRTITGFMASEHVQSVTKKTALNYHTALSSLWRWAVENDYASENIVRKVKPPVPEKREIIPLTRTEIIRLLDACAGGNNPARDRAILLMLLDTGIRASEIGSLRVRDFNLPERRLLVMGKGRKERVLRISPRTLSALEIYLAQRGIHMSKSTAKSGRAHLFVTEKGVPISRDALRLMLERLGRRASVPNVHPHRFRHTFAINFLRNGGNIYTLQRFLGHTTLEMVRRYLKIAQVDLDADHDKASPVENWYL